MPRVIRASLRLALNPESQVAERPKRRAGPKSRSRKSLTMPSSSIQRPTRESWRRHPSSWLSPCLNWWTSSRSMARLLERWSEIFTQRISSDRSVITMLPSPSTLVSRLNSLKRSEDQRKQAKWGVNRQLLFSSYTRIFCLRLLHKHSRDIYLSQLQSLSPYFYIKYNKDSKLTSY